MPDTGAVLDPLVIDYCLDKMRVAFGRVEMPWAMWDMQGAEGDHVKRSAEMARRLKQIGMPVIVSCWFPPLWAGTQTTRSFLIRQMLMIS